MIPLANEILQVKIYKWQTQAEAPQRYSLGLYITKV